MIKKLTIYALIANLTGCSIYSAMHAPQPVNYKDIKAGSDRLEVVSILGQPKLTDLKNYNHTDYFEFVDGYNGAYKARILPYLAGDVFTLGLAEFIFWPLEELALEGSLNTATVQYDVDDKLEKIIVVKKSDKEILYSIESSNSTKSLSKINMTIAISRFNCNCDDIVKESIQDSLLDTFFKSSFVKPVKGELGDIIIRGSAVMSDGSTNRSENNSVGSSSVYLAPYGSGYSSTSDHKLDSSASGVYLSVINVQAYKNGLLIASESVGQDLGQGSLLSTQVLASKAASGILKALISKKVIER